MAFTAVLSYTLSITKLSLPHLLCATYRLEPGLNVKSKAYRQGPLRPSPAIVVFTV